jgi:hypothetical protein
MRVEISTLMYHWLFVELVSACKQFIMWIVHSEFNWMWPYYEDKLFLYHLHSPNSIIQLNCDRLPECFAESPRTHAIPSGHFGDSVASVPSPRQGV